MPSPWRDRRVQLGLWVLPVVIAGWIVGGVLHARTPAPLPVAGEARYGMTEAQRRALFMELVKHEPKWRASGKRKFGKRPWSADDDYHWHVQAHVERAMAKRHKLPPSHIWAQVDEAVHARWTPDKSAVRRIFAGLAAAQKVPRPGGGPAAASPRPQRRPPGALRATVPPLRPRVL